MCRAGAAGRGRAPPGGLKGPSRDRGAKPRASSRAGGGTGHGGAGSRPHDSRLMVIDLDGSSPESLSASRGAGPAAISPSGEEVIYVPPAAAAASAVVVHPAGPRNDGAAPDGGCRSLPT